MSDPRCKCPMTISVTGDGCRYCQPQSYIDSLEEWLEEKMNDNDLTRITCDCIDFKRSEGDE